MANQNLIEIARKLDKVMQTLPDILFLPMDFLENYLLKVNFQKMTYWSRWETIKIDCEANGFESRPSLITRTRMNIRYNGLNDLLYPN